ncbi:MAG: MraY family glycosyltransferase, partial [Candidatus Omnitrophota bacterium]
MFFLNTAANVVVSAVWIIAITNAFNLLDIMDGLCAGVTIVIASGLLFVCILSNDMQNAVLLLVMIGSVGGFLMSNMPPAKVYLGNAGSHFLGFMLAAISINISYASLNHEVSLLSPLLIMGFPIYDTFFVAFLRLKKGKSAIKKSKDH